MLNERCEYFMRGHDVTSVVKVFDGEFFPKFLMTLMTHDIRDDISMIMNYEF